MRLLVVHLSDIHLREAPRRNVIVERVEPLKRAIAAEVRDHDAQFCLVVLTGDIAFAGTTPEYDIAERLLRSLRDQLAKELSIDVLLVAVPGNHDCDFRETTPTRAALLDHALRNGRADASFIPICTKPQEEFFRFASKLSGGLRSFNAAELYVHVPIDVGDFKIDVHLLNSAWCSFLNEKPSAIHFPIDLLPASPMKAGQFSIGLLHHPFSWFEPENGKRIRQRLEAVCDFILSGHEHDPDSHTRINRNDRARTYVEGGVLQDSSNTENSTFITVLVDLAGAESIEAEHRWNSQEKIYQRKVQTKRTSLRGKAPKVHGLEFKDKFLEYTRDPGAAYTHPRKEDLELQDLFVYPDFKETDLYRAHSETTKGIVRGAQVLEYSNKHHHLCISGPDKSGRTALAKMLVLHFQASGLIPILLDGMHTPSNHKEVVGLLEDAFARQYESPSLETFRQTPPNQRVVIVDDLDRANQSSKSTDGFIEVLSKLVDRIVVFAPSDLLMGALMLNKSATHPLFGFRLLEIMELGHLGRGKLIERWQQLGSPSLDDAEVMRTSETISSMLGRDFIPAYPGFVLMMLQSLETHKKHDTSASGAFGHLYSFLITGCLGRAGAKVDDFDTYYNYMSELAFMMFERKAPVISRNDLVKWHGWFNNKFALALSFDKVTDTLMRADLIQCEEDAWMPKYKYVFYYFVGQYLAQHVSDAGCRTIVQTLASQLYHEESANITLFVAHFCKDPMILELVMNAAARIFSAHKPAQLAEDTPALLGGKSTLVLAASNVDVNRHSLWESTDEHAIVQGPGENKSGATLALEAVTGEDEIFNEALQVNASFKTIQILGQVLRSFSGSIPGDVKVRIAQECFNLGLRTLSFFYTIMEEHNEEVIESLISFLRERREDLDDEARENMARRFVYGLLRTFSYASIRHISDAVGAENLDPVFERLMEQDPSPAYQLIFLSVRLDSYRGFPKQDVLRFAKTYHANLPAMEIIRHLVWRHFYLYLRAFNVRQEICARLQIKVKPRPEPQTGTPRKSKRLRLKANN